MDENKIKFRKLLPILPGLLTPSEAPSEIVHPEVGLQVNRDRLPGLSRNNDLNITEITNDGYKLNKNPNNIISHAGSTSYLEERILHLEQSNQRLSQALFALSSRVSTVETVSSCNVNNFHRRPDTSKSGLIDNLGVSSTSLMEAMKISNELISELSQRVRKSELAIDGMEFRRPHQVNGLKP